MRFNLFKKQQKADYSDFIYRLLYPFLSSGIKLDRDTSLTANLKKGYEENVDVFSISNRIASMFSRVPYKVFKGEAEVQQDPLKELFSLNAADYSFKEFRRRWEMFNILTGNAIVYCLSPEGGTNKGTVKYMRILPTQYVDIQAGGPLKPVKSYKLIDLGTDISIEPKDVWHTRGFDNLEYRDGANFLGISPLKVASLIIQSQNSGYELINKMEELGMPPGVLFPKGQTFDNSITPEQQKNLEAAWKKKYTGNDRKGIPVFAPSEMGWIPLGFSSMKDLMIIENSQEGRRVLCNIWGVPSELFNDKASSTYNNISLAQKSIYTNRIVPDTDLFFEGINNLFQKTGLRYEPDWSQVSEMQEDRKVTAETWDIGVRNGSYSLNEFRDKMGDDPDPELEGLYFSDTQLPDEMNPDNNELMRNRNDL